MTDILDPDHPDLVAHYSGTGLTQGLVPDETGNHNGSNFGLTAVAGLVGDAMNCNGSSRAEIADSPALDFGDEDFSISLWVFLRSQATNRAMLTKTTAFSDAALNYAIDQSPGDGWLFRIKDSGANYIYSNKDYRINEWVHLLARYKSGRQLSLKVNNVLAASGSIAVTPSPNSGKLYLGSYYTSSGMDGMLDQVRIFKKWVTDDECTQLFEELFPYEIRGLVSIDGAPLSTQVRLYSAASGELLNTLNTDANGEYQKVLSTADPVYAMAIEPNGYRPLVHGPINPALRNPS
jgi:hypothetical protein